MPRNLTAPVPALLGAAVSLMLTPSLAFAHAGDALGPDNIWTAWSLEPLIVISLVASAWLYTRGIRRLWRAADTGAGIRKWEASSFAGGWLVIAVALVSPLHALGGVLFAAHMIQHELLISIAAPLLVLGRPIVAFLWALPQHWRRKAGVLTRNRSLRTSWRMISIPAVAFGLHAIALWTWHLPRLYQATLTSELVHSLQHTSFLFTAILFWWAIFAARGGELRRGAAVFYLFATVLQTGALGALLTFGQTLWYPAYAATTSVWGITPLEDQQLGGLIMWIPGSLAYVAAALVIFAGWLREAERRSQQRELGRGPGGAEQADTDEERPLGAGLVELSAGGIYVDR
jgi:putative membrane protein